MTAPTRAQAERSSTVKPGDDTVLTGWGRTAPSRARVVTPLDADDVAGLLATTPTRGVLARGLGRSYGDAGQNAGGVVLDTTALAGVHDADLERGVVTVGPGTTFDALMRWLVPRGWFVPVTPGTRLVTVGGAIAADVHGKNHHVDGSFGDHLHAMTLQPASGAPMTLTPDGTPEEFWATVGGMGLTGIILDATFDLVPIETSWMQVDTERARDLDDLMSRMEARDQSYRYSVAWIDCLARGASLGRGVIDFGDHAPIDALPTLKRAHPRRFAPRPIATTPPFVPNGLVNRHTIRAFNELWFRKARDQQGHIVSIPFFFHPLDMLLDWNRMYGSRGFLQYQFVVPFGAEDTVRRAVERLSAAGAASFLAVLKRFGRQNPGMLSFPMPGWTLTLDIPIGDPDLSHLLDDLDDLVLAVGGRVYLAKDSRVPRDRFARMYPRLAEWQAVRARLDPEGRIQSDLARRLGL